MYSVAEVARAVGRAQSTIQKWVAVDRYVTPAIRAHGTGDRHQFSDDNIRQLRVVSAIIEHLGDGAATRGMIADAVARVRPDQLTVVIKVEITL